MGDIEGASLDTKCNACNFVPYFFEELRQAVNRSSLLEATPVIKQEVLDVVKDGIEKTNFSAY